MKYLFTIACVLSLFVHAKSQQIKDGRIASVVEQIAAFKKQEIQRDSLSRQPLGSFTEASFRRQYDFYKTQQAALRTIDAATLSFDDRVNFALIQHEILDRVAAYEFQSYLNPILADEGFHTSLARRGNVILTTVNDAEQYLALLRDVPRYVGEHLDLMRKGLITGISQPKVIFIGYENTYAQHIVSTADSSVFWKPFSQRPVAINETAWVKYRDSARQVINNEVVKSYRLIRQFFKNEYLPKTKTELGASSFLKGRDFYQDRVRHFTSTNMTAEEVYQVGISEVSRIRAAMEAVIREVDFKGSFKEFFTYLRSDPKFFPSTAEQLLKEASFIAKKADGKLPALFGKLPRLPYTVVPVPGYLAPTYTTGRYSGATRFGKRAGEYWVNTYNLPSRTLYTLEALTLHEAVPGHHLQTSLAQELDNLPEFRKNIYINAFGEGWGLYCEYLGHEMGFYQDPYSLFGRLTYEMWRACRLVVDVGIHQKNWTREQAVNYLSENSALSLHEVNTEVNRYISWPGQALAYKIGEIKIKELRKKTEEALKENFDVRAFHDMILSQGSVTLDVLEMMTDRFIGERLKANGLR